MDGHFFTHGSGPLRDFFFSSFCSAGLFLEIAQPRPVSFDRSICTLLNFYYNFLLGIYSTNIISIVFQVMFQVGWLLYHWLMFGWMVMRTHLGQQTQNYQLATS